MKIIKERVTFWMVSWILLYSSTQSQLWNNHRCCLSYTVNTMPADALATLGASASAGMVLTPKAGIFRLQYQKDWLHQACQWGKLTLARSPAHQCECILSWVCRKLAWASGILYKRCKGHLFLGKCSKNLVPHTAFKFILPVLNSIFLLLYYATLGPHVIA